MATFYNSHMAYTQQSMSALMRGELGNPRREPFHGIVKAAWFRITGLLMSLGVIIEYGVVADQNLDKNHSVVQEVFGYIFAVYFLVEIVIRFLEYIHPMEFFTDPVKRRFNILDLILALNRLITTFILAYTLHDPHFTAIRMFRAVGMLRITRLWYFVPEIAVTIDAMLSAARNALPIFSTMIITMYCGGVVSTIWVKKTPGMISSTFNNEPDFYYNRWGTIGYSMMTQLQLSVYDDVSTTLNGAYVFSTTFTVFIVVMILVNAFMILNTLIGFIYDLVAETTERGNALELSRAINKTFTMIDKDLSGDITEEEYQANAVPALKRFGINEDVVERAFDIIDSNANGSIDKAEFTAYLLKMLRPPSNEELINLMSELNLVERDIDEIETIIKQGTSVELVQPGKSVRLRKGVFLTTIRSPEKKERKAD